MQVRRRRTAAFLVDLFVTYVCVTCVFLAVMAFMLLLNYVSYTGFINMGPVYLGGVTRIFYKLFSAEMFFYFSTAGLFVYYGYHLQKTDQATVGMKLFSIKVQNINIQKKYMGGPISVWTACAYFPFMLMCSFPFARPGFIVIFPLHASALFSVHKRFPHDYLLKTMVVRSDLPAFFDGPSTLLSNSA